MYHFSISPSSFIDKFSLKKLLGDYVKRIMYNRMTLLDEKYASNKLETYNHKLLQNMTNNLNK